MENFRVLLFSISQFRGILDIGYTAEQSQIITDLLFVFSAEFDVDNQKVSIDYKHRYTSAFKARLDDFIARYKHILPQIQQLGTRFNKLEKDEWFFVLPPETLDTKQRYGLEKELEILNGLAGNENEDEIQDLFGCIMNNYELLTFDLDTDKKIKIGEGQKHKRVCRFCQRRVPDVSFKKEAHAISEALGNKKLILNEECDDCNEFFDENVERDFIYYHDLARTMFGVKNKENDIPKIKGKDFHFFKSDEKKLSIAIVSSDKNKNNGSPPESLVFRTGNKIKLQNIYKALCKFTLSVIDSVFISDFSETIKWIKNEKEASALPKVAVLNSYHFFTKRPELTLYLRNSNNSELPYLVGEFKFTFYVYVFIVPFSHKDKTDYLDDDVYAKFLDCFKHVKSTEKFNFIDLSQNIERELNFKINFKRNKS